jgi:peptide-methionine (R)-S-oxide reductase
MKRRSFVRTLGGLCLVAPMFRLASAAEHEKTTGQGKVVRTEEQWRRSLTSQQYRVLREQGTERPWSSPLNEEKRAGTYLCAGCEQPLFTSTMKFDSGTGWPSFYDVIGGAVATSRDFKLILPRTEYHCARCGGHHGHVFNDGPEPTGLRYCNNGVVLKFVPVTA